MPWHKALGEPNAIRYFIIVHLYATMLRQPLGIVIELFIFIWMLLIMSTCMYIHIHIYIYYDVSSYIISCYTGFVISMCSALQGSDIFRQNTA